MEILFVNKYAAVAGGADRHMLDLARMLRGRGHEVRLLSFRSTASAPMPGRYIEPTVTNENRETISLLGMANVARTVVWNSEAARAMRGLIDDRRPAVVHFHKTYPQISVSPIVVASRRKVPVVQTAHDYEFGSASPADHLARAIDSTSPGAADRVVNTVSYGLRRAAHVPRVDRWIVASEHMERWYRARGIEAEVLPLPIEPAPAGAGGFHERNGFVFAGRLDWRKGVPDVIELARRRPGFEVLVAGMGELAGMVERAASELANLRFVGQLDAAGLTEAVARARVAILPARWQEPAGLVALEAMQLGTPVVAYESGGLSDNVKASRGGAVVAQGELGALVEAATALHEDKAAWERASSAGREGVASRHDPERYVSRIEAIYRELAGRG